MVNDWPKSVTKVSSMGEYGEWIDCGIDYDPCQLSVVLVALLVALSASAVGDASHQCIGSQPETPFICTDMLTGTLVKSIIAQAGGYFTSDYYLSQEYGWVKRGNFESFHTNRKSG